MICFLYVLLGWVGIERRTDGVVGVCCFANVAGCCVIHRRIYVYIWLDRVSVCICRYMYDEYLLTHKKHIYDYVEGYVTWKWSILCRCNGAVVLSLSDSAMALLVSVIWSERRATEKVDILQKTL